MSDIEPTEEQEQASRAVFYGFPDIHLDMLLEHGAPRVARLLAEREAKLTKLATDWAQGLEAQHLGVVSERDTLQARVAELEAERGAHWQRVDDGEHPDGCPDAACGECHECVRVRDLQIDVMCDERNAFAEREAQHLADIKALQSLLHRWVSSYVGGRHGEDARSLVDVTYSALTGAPLTLYDDAKAAAPECPKCQEGTHPFYDVEQARWLCDRCHHPAFEPFPPRGDS